jgi:hypothetical protein
MAGGHVRLPTPPTTRERLQRLKKRTATRNYSIACGAFKGSVPYKVRRTLERHELLARENFSPRKGTGVRRSPRGPFETKRAPQAPMPRRTLERHEPWLGIISTLERVQA